MVICKNCNYKNPHGTDYCINCHEKLPKPEINSYNENNKINLVIQKANTKKQEDSQVNLKEDIHNPDNNYSGTYYNVYYKGSDDIIMNNTKKPWLAVLLCMVITSLGYFYIKSYKKGIIFFIMALIAGIIMTYYINFIYIWIIIAIYQLYDVYKETIKYNQKINTKK
ncbi:MAG: hypothetical protein Q4Q23_01470 [Methanobacteriaceae archaeon]|nr:hypothetical protein [Methanobacteriaceae archaeon]